MIAWITMLLFWPWGQDRPLMGVWEAVQTFSSFSEIHQSFFQGNYVDSDEIPRYYAPFWFLLTLPEFLLVGLATGIYWLWRSSPWMRMPTLEIGLLITAACFPIAYAIASAMPLYDGIRHLLFVIPPLAILAALGVSRFLTLPGRPAQLFGPILAGLILLAAYDMIVLHPNQYTYFNRLFAGGVLKASANYETDYWHNSYKQAMAWLDRQPRSEGQSLRLASHYANLPLYITNSPSYTYETRPESADIYLGATRFDEHRIIPGEVVHIVRAQGAALLYIIRPNSTFQDDPLFAQSAFRHVSLGDQYKEKGDIENALMAYQKAIAINPNDYRTLNHLGELYYGLEQYTRAADYFRKTIALKPNLPQAHNNLGVIFYRTNQYSEAIDAFHKALSFKFDFASAHFNLANALYRSNKNEAAIAAYQESLRLQPGFLPALKNLAQVYFFSHNLDASLPTYEEMVRLTPEDAKTHIAKGYVLVTMNRSNEALTAFRKAVRLAPGEIMAWEGLSDLLAEQGKTEEAISAYRQILALDPGHAVAKEKLEILRLQP